MSVANSKEYSVRPATAGEVLDSIVYFKEEDGSYKYVVVKFQSANIPQFPNHFFSSGMIYEGEGDEKEQIKDSAETRFGIKVNSISKVASEYVESIDKTLHYYFAESDSSEIKDTGAFKEFKILSIDEVTDDLVFPLTAEVVRYFDASK